MKKIGFIDYYISEWHANNYPAWISAANKALGTDYKVTYVWAESDISPVDGVNTDAWCERFGAEKCASIDELCEKSDVVMILSPSNPEKHLAYAAKALPFGKPTYIDKTFAPDLDTAKKIFAIAERYGTPFFSTSALRYADELKDFSGSENITVIGGGSNLSEYIVHTAEMAVVLLGDPIKSAQLTRSESALREFSVITEGGKRASIVFSPSSGFSVLADKPSGDTASANICSDFFANLLRTVIEFYETSVLPFDSKETLEVMRMRDLLIAASEHSDK